VFAAKGARRERTSEFCDALHTYPISPSHSLDYDGVLAHVASVHQLFHDESSRYEHYKWYVGPRRDLMTPAFVTRSEFDQRFALR